MVSPAGFGPWAVVWSSLSSKSKSVWTGKPGPTGERFETRERKTKAVAFVTCLHDVKRAE